MTCRCHDNTAELTHWIFE